MILLLALACLSPAARAEAKMQSVEFGPQFAMPLPTHDIGDAELGLDLGLTVTAMRNSVLGFGADLVYHYWPASPEYKSAYDQFLRRATYQLIDDSTWAFSALQATGHVKLVAPLRGAVKPWIEAGLGAYRVNRNLEGLWAISKVSYEAGYFGTAGIEFPTSAGTKLGLDISYHELWSRHVQSWDPLFGPLGSVRQPGFSAFMLGVHVLFLR